MAVAAGLALAPTSAQAATSPEVESATAWLASQIPEDTIVQNLGFPDFGLTIDFALAFYETRTQTAVAEAIVDALDADPRTVSEYATNVGFGDREDSQISGATAKIATLAQQSGRDASDFAGVDLIEDVEGVVADDGDEIGRGMDVSDFGENSNSIGQSFVVRALTGAGSDEADAATTYLMNQQCGDGSFRITMTAGGCGATGGDTVSIDATAFVIEALTEAREAGFSGADEAISDAAAFLVGVQEDDGSFMDTGAFNTNTSGLAGYALELTGESAAATKAADFVAGLQLPQGAGDDAGAIAYDQSAFDEAKANGIPENLGDQFRRASAQAVLSLPHVSSPAGPVAAMTLKVSDVAPTAGDTVTVTATGKDADDRSTGDVTGDITLESSVSTDTIRGNKVTFNSASPHTITATHVPTGTTASILVEVSPAAASGPDDEVSGGEVSESGPGAADGNATVVNDARTDLPNAGTPVQAWQLVLAAAMMALGTVLLLARGRTAGHVAGHRR